MTHENITQEVDDWTLTAEDLRPDYADPQVTVESPCGVYLSSASLALDTGNAMDENGHEKRVPDEVLEALEGFYAFAEDAFLTGAAQ
jgi:hypothetical protein